MTKKTNTHKRTNTQAAVETKSGSLGAIVGSLIPLTTKELEPAHAGATDIQGDAGRFAVDLGMEQPGIRTFALNIPATPYQDLTERKKQLGCARRLCLALKERFGWIPVLKEKDLVTSEAQAKALLADPFLRRKVKSTAVVKFAETGCFWPTDDRTELDALVKQRLVLNLLTLWICFTRAYKSAGSWNPARSHGREA